MHFSFLRLLIDLKIKKLYNAFMSLQPKMTVVKKIDRGSLPMLALTVPIFFESLFRMLVSSVDTVMLSSYSQEAVAAVGMTAQFIFFIQILFNVICIGVTIVLAQYIGANRESELKQVAQASTVMIVIFSVVMTLVVIFGAEPLLNTYTLDDSVRKHAHEYLVILGGFGAVFFAFNLLQSSILKAYGYTKDAMFISITANIVNVIGNAAALYGPFGLPVLGVPGVAASSVFSQFIACILFAYKIQKKPDVYFSLKGIAQVPAKIYKTILAIGIPTAGESLSYNVAQIVIMAMITTLGTAAMTSQVYTQTIVRFVFVTAMAIGNAVQIKTGYFVGAKQPDKAYRSLYKYQIIGTAITMLLIIIVNLVKAPLISLFTKDAAIFSLVSSLLIFSAYIEFGRSINLITIGALKGAGDVKFPVLYGIFSMWFFMVLGSYLLGITAGLGMIGIWLSIGTDETMRGIVMLFRWKTKRWKTKALA